ncbi:hypothetical protein FLJC2902T_28220 [Flavobacterium limnosediminis JC2902]|uniref:DUF3300 domain-containing protein n=1 Tax=Flavobacterium limnosediminis JC2902 TaxID=1341181 RepID=V6SIR4_9FLAO|nr:hypothetical protein [Flavobacterium limnosediminis]ESU26339.1 hypothetical protein FLJC2902T_28220 [Flavobacterium limnosediminis JC2902]
MKNWISIFVLISVLNVSVYSQDTKDSGDPPALGLPGDNLDLYAVLDLFQKSKTIEGFEKSLNEQKTGINNLDLDLDKKVDFIKVVTKQKESSFTFILQVAVSKTEEQDVAVILVDKDKNGKVSLQIVGDEDLYGKDYVIEPKGKETANPGYTGNEPVTQQTTSTTTVVVEQVPIVQYVYSPAYVPYYPPYYYGYYPPYFAAFTIMAVGIYRHNHYHYHGGYYGGHYHGGGNTVVINNRNSYNNYNNNKMRSNTVANNKASGRYDGGNRATAGTSNRPSAGTSNRPSGGASASTRPSTGTSNRPSAGTSASTRPSTGTSNFGSSSSRPSTSNSSMSSGRTRSSSSSNFSSGGMSRGGGGGMSRGGGGGGRRR